MTVNSDRFELDVDAPDAQRDPVEDRRERIGHDSHLRVSSGRSCIAWRTTTVPEVERPGHRRDDDREPVRRALVRAGQVRLPGQEERVRPAPDRRSTVPTCEPAGHDGLAFGVPVLASASASPRPSTPARRRASPASPAAASPTAPRGPDRCHARENDSTNGEYAPACAFSRSRRECRREPVDAPVSIVNDPLAGSQWSARSTPIIARAVSTSRTRRRSQTALRPAEEVQLESR